MKREFIKGHNAAIAARYGIKNVESFRCAARRYEVRLNHFAELMCNSEKLWEWAERQFDETAQQARKNLCRYCRNHNLLSRELWFNSDPRGYAIKLTVTRPSRRFMCAVDRDWGSDYVVAPQAD